MVMKYEPSRNLRNVNTPLSSVMVENSPTRTLLNLTVKRRFSCTPGGNSTCPTIVLFPWRIPEARSSSIPVPPSCAQTAPGNKARNIAQSKLRNKRRVNFTAAELNMDGCPLHRKSKTGSWDCVVKYIPKIFSANRTLKKHRHADSRYHTM